MSSLNDKGLPKIETFFCRKCGFTTKWEGALQNHIRVHRDGKTPSYHDKENLLKSGKYTYEP